MNPYPFHLEKDLIAVWIALFKQSIQGKVIVTEKLRRQFELLDSYSAFTIEREILSRINRKKTLSGINTKNLNTILTRKYFPNLEASKILSDLAHGKIYRQDADLAIPSLVGQPGITEEFLNETLRKNVALISKLSNEQRDKIGALLSEGLSSGLSYDAIAENIAKATNVSIEKAKFWATDQSSKFFSDVTRQRQKAIGFPGFIWVTVKDSKVRPTHLRFEGQFYNWEKGTGENNRSFPGQDYRCRCFARPAWPEDVDPQYQIKSEQRRWDLNRETSENQRAFDDFYARLTREAEETPFAEQSRPFQPSRVKTTNEELEKVFNTTTKDFTDIFDVNKNELDKNTFRAILPKDAKTYNLEIENGQVRVSGIYSANDSLIAINLGEVNKNLTAIHELAHWMYSEYAVLRNDPELQKIVKEYIDTFKGKILEEKYYLGEADVFSRIIEFMVAQEKEEIYTIELERKRRFLKNANKGVDLFDPKILSKYSEKLSLILKGHGLKK
jgi:SPP1 gp7 family putative phage head morphogenesis protein